MRTFGLDLDRVGEPEPLVQSLRRRLAGRYPVDAFGGDPLVQDVVAAVGGAMTVQVVNGDALPEIGSAALVCNRRPGFADPAVVRRAVRLVRRRRARVVGYVDGPITGPLARRLGAVRGRADDLAAVLRAGHLAIVPLSPSVRGAGAPPPALLPALTAPVIPVAVSGVGRRRRVVVGAPVAAARAGEAVAALLRGA